MGWLQRVSTVAAPARIRGESASQRMSTAFWAGEPIGWFEQLVASGISITPNSH
jgi:hypothetical protein